jgi:hypothetical protein
MKHMNIEDAVIERRLKILMKIGRRLDRLADHIEKAPSFSGKCACIDHALRASGEIANLISNIRYDYYEARRKSFPGL